MDATDAAAHAQHPLDIDDAIARACARIAPTWPLDRFIAVNPFWGLTQRPLPEVAAELASLSGARLLMPRAWYRQARAEGGLRDAHLQEAIAQLCSSVTLAQLLVLLERDEAPIPRRSRVMDVMDGERDLVHQVSWRDFVTNSTSQFCAAFFDESQASVGPHREGGLYASWRRQAQDDKAPALLMGLRSYRDSANQLPLTAGQMARLALTDLDVPEGQYEQYLAGLLLDLNGWASWCTYRRWTARLAGQDDATIVDLLAIRLAWEWLLHRASGKSGALRWQLAISAWPKIDELARASLAEDWLFQKAMEIAWQERVTQALPRGLANQRPQAPAVQAAFCIDVRSEVFRRALERETDAVQTLGFAGFFGLPIDYQPLGAPEARPQLPGLLAASLRAANTGLSADAADQRSVRLQAAGAWRSLKTGPVSAFAFVEAMGITYAAHLLADSFGTSAAPPVEAAGLSREAAALQKPRLMGGVDGEAISVEARSDLAAGVLRAMGLTHGFARLVLLAGHGSQTRNNPHAAGLDCGACCGQTGEVNARAAAALLNEPAVREGLAARGITVPGSTRFIAGLHNTTADEVTLFDLDELPPSHECEVIALRTWLAAAGDGARTERSKGLGLAGRKGAALWNAVRRRTRDWAQVRPEWGLANNASFIVAPREHTRHLNLEGRSFLHDYRFEEDEGFGVLELIMTAPMVVTHWINLQYYASTVDNARYGSGNKVLHNVVGGHLGVFEGNGGDLRIGLPLQSLHDGERWVHTPLRLSVFIEAPREAIEGVLQKHEKVRGLVSNGWLDLFQLDARERAVHAYRAQQWVRQLVDGE